ncbi:NADH ubiquinone oxidoreductase subunit NDUFA12-domain-containing protein [Microdochium trichocladiopsis]|uniref:NADH dehydrogenase [ubiquinone] 1 alpha subcomplex subunit n=1 Tax=Microdochium trichocladiopsis TaxID=1682393 RepID=A0A9P8Y9U9_9PEZI|nr:NADH ubiquinone oxidoreductase subunit NDUFA12-domain-containing protein [Microdochium trichocladiopsis]KAH7033633.1 NADH ubiquinone oxidoreductase subunit NDUFA12-domain-containing protein [Microdochium trichocladiopsis]
MSTIGRTLKNLGRVGIKDFFKQMNYIGDTKAGALIGTDRFGNKYFENNDELPLRTRWVQYASKDPDAAQIEPGWHAWMSYNLDKAPSQDPTVGYQRREWEDTDAKTIPNYTQTRGAYKPYSTVKSKIATWEPVAVARK